MFRLTMLARFTVFRHFNCGSRSGLISGDIEDRQDNPIAGAHVILRNDGLRVDDNQPLGTEHWIEWKTPKPVTVRSVGLFAAHDQVGLKRSFSDSSFT